MAFLASA
jgi:hypothetical protein